jgi:hypothetical protein
MITNKIADAVIARAKAELANDNKRPAQMRRGEPLGDYVQMVFTAVTSDEHHLPINNDMYHELSRCNDAARCREIILAIAE